MSKHNIKVNAMVRCISGACSGRTGRVLRIKADRVFVEGLQISKKHVKAGQERGAELSIHISNLVRINE